MSRQCAEANGIRKIEPEKRINNKNEHHQPGDIEIHCEKSENETVKRMKELAKLARAVGNTTATEDREEPVVEEENEGQRKITEFLLVENDDDEDDNSLSTQELIIDARARKVNKNKGKLECDDCEFETW